MPHAETQRRGGNAKKIGRRDWRCFLSLRDTGWGSRCYPFSLFAM
jgi:hypothetical protein